MADDTARKDKWMNDNLACIAGLLLLAGIGVILWKALIYMEENQPEPHSEVKGGFGQESRLFKGPRGIMAAAALAESHRSGRERWRTGRVVLEDKDIDQYTVHHAQWLVDNARNFPAWGIRIDNRLSAEPQEVHRRAFREQHRNYREIPQYPDERGIPVDLKAEKKVRR